MKVALILCLVAPALGAVTNNAGDRGLPLFHIVSERTANGAPEMRVSFPNGLSDRLVLQKYSSAPEDEEEDKDACNFLGHLEQEKSACVAVTGCPGKDKLEITMLSRHNTAGSMFAMNTDGSTTLIENPFKDGLARSVALDIDRDAGWQRDGDEEVNEVQNAAEMQVGASCANGGCSLPPTMKLRIKVGYDDSFRRQVGNVNSWVNSVFTHVQTHYCHPSLGTKIQIQRVASPKYFKGSWKADSAKEGLDIVKNIAKGDSSTDLWVFFCRDEDADYGTVGLAWRGTLCENTYSSEYRASMNEWRKTMPDNGYVVAHEMGHNLNMAHDFNKKNPNHMAEGCNNQGIMSYGDAPHQWSQCSKNDLMEHLQYIKKTFGKWCLPAANNLKCTSSSPSPDSGCGSPEYKTDAYCDDDNNNAGCKYDNGACCRKTNTNPNYQQYCKQCQCKQ